MRSFLKRKRLLIITILVVVISVIMGCVLFVLSDDKVGNIQDGDVYVLRLTPRTNGGETKHQKSRIYRLKVAFSDEAKARGLSNTSPLNPEEGMIFIFDTSAERCFWMKDMNYPLDIIWVDSQKIVTAIEHAVEPASYPESFCHQGQYVIELGAGDAKNNEIKKGDILYF